MAAWSRSPSAENAADTLPGTSLRRPVRQIEDLGAGGREDGGVPAVGRHGRRERGRDRRIVLQHDRARRRGADVPEQEPAPRVGRDQALAVGREEDAAHLRRVPFEALAGARARVPEVEGAARRPDRDATAGRGGELARRPVEIEAGRPRPGGEIPRGEGARVGGDGALPVGRERAAGDEVLARDAHARLVRRIPDLGVLVRTPHQEPIAARRDPHVVDVRERRSPRALERARLSRPRSAPCIAARGDQGRAVRRALELAHDAPVAGEGHEQRARRERVDETLEGLRRRRIAVLERHPDGRAPSAAASMRRSGRDESWRAVSPSAFCSSRRARRALSSARPRSSTMRRTLITPSTASARTDTAAMRSTARCRRAQCRRISPVV